MTNLRPVKGCKDLFGQDILQFRYIIEKFKAISQLYSCQEIYTPIMEHTEIFARSLGEFSDVVTKEMYSFIDQGEDRLTLRPEFTAAITRAIFSNGLQNQLPLRLFSYGPLFRRERPQAGRQRQFHQINVEFLGFSEAYIDAEVIRFAADILDALEITNYSLEINSLGCTTSRANYSKVLFEYFSDNKSSLSEISQIRLEKNPMRILDSKDQGDQVLVAAAPKIEQYYTLEAAQYFAGVLESLADLKVSYKINPNIVRGLDYYSHTAFEFISNDLSAQSAIIAGGRYDGLSSMMGNTSIPSIGFAGGIERLMILSKQTPQTTRPVVIVPMSKDEQVFAMKTAHLLRQQNINCLVESSKKLGDAINKAVSKHGARYVIILGSNEVKNDQYALKDLDNSSQEIVSLPQMLKILEQK
jgi:histidyl-tRNA synthetase